MSVSSKMSKKNLNNTCLDKMSSKMYEKEKRSIRVNFADEVEVFEVEVCGGSKEGGGSKEEKLAKRIAAKEEKMAERNAAKEKKKEEKLEEKKIAREVKRKQKQLPPGVIQIQVEENLQENVLRFHREYERAPTLYELNVMYEEVYGE